MLWQVSGDTASLECITTKTVQREGDTKQEKNMNIKACCSDDASCHQWR